MLLSVLPLILGVCFIAVGLWVTWHRAGASSVSRAMVCVACGAPAAALSSFVCGICGGDVRLVGIAPAAARGRWRLHPVTRVALLALPLALVSLVVSNGMFERTRGSISRQVVRFGGDEHGPPMSVEIVSNIRTSRGQAVAGDGAVTIVTEGALATLNVEIPSLQTTIVSDDGQVGTPTKLSATSFDDLARAAGLDPAQQRVRNQLDLIRETFERFVAAGESPGIRIGGATGFNASSSSGSGMSVMPDPGPGRWTFAGAGAAWLVGVLWLLRKRGGEAGAAADVERATVSATASAGGAS